MEMGRQLPDATASRAKACVARSISDPPSPDDRFAKLVGPDWRLLPAPIRRRFSHALAPGGCVVYVGVVGHTRMSGLGWLFAQAGRAIGAPLPLERSGRRAATVIVTQSDRSSDQLWTRVYGRRGAFPQIIQSAKRFAGSTGIEEVVRGGFGMSLNVRVENRALVFRSAGYFFRCAGWTMGLPAWLMPGEIEVMHREERDGRFSFTLSVRHPLAGTILEQVAFFRDPTKSS
jgi:hypothetical protein